METVLVFFLSSLVFVLGGRGAGRYTPDVFPSDNFDTSTQTSSLRARNGSPPPRSVDSSFTIATTVTLFATCFEPADTLKLCCRNRKQKAIEADHLSHVDVRHAPRDLNHSATLETPGAQQPQYGGIGAVAANSVGLGQTANNLRRTEVDVESSFGFDRSSLPGYVQFFKGGRAVPEGIPSMIKTTTLTDVLPLNCLAPGQPIPANICNVPMILPAPPSELLDQYCLTMARLAGASLAGCRFVPPWSFIQIDFARGPQTPYPNKKVIMKNIVNNLKKTGCDLAFGLCEVPDMPSSFLLNIYDICVPGIEDVPNFIAEILGKIYGKANLDFDGNT